MQLLKVNLHKKLFSPLQKNLTITSVPNEIITLESLQKAWKLRVRASVLTTMAKPAEPAAKWRLRLEWIDTMTNARRMDLENTTPHVITLRIFSFRNNHEFTLLCHFFLIFK